MKRYWWVNHKQTSRQELSGNFLWSPKTEANGARSRFYDNLRTAAPGDMILSFAHGKISYVGYVVGFAFNSPKPAEFDSIVNVWASRVATACHLEPINDRGTAKGFSFGNRFALTFKILSDSGGYRRGKSESLLS